jgi:hypothetical protein
MMLNSKLPKYILHKKVRSVFSTLSTGSSSWIGLAHVNVCCKENLVVIQNRIYILLSLFIERGSLNSNRSTSQVFKLTMYKVEWDVVTLSSSSKNNVT